MFRSFNDIILQFAKVLEGIGLKRMFYNWVEFFGDRKMDLS